MWNICLYLWKFWYNLLGDIFARVRHKYHILKGPEINKYKSVISSCKEQEADDAGNISTIGDAVTGTMEDLWTSSKAYGIYDDEDTINSERHYKYFEHETWFQPRKET